MYRRIFVITVVVLSLLGTTLPAHAACSTQTGTAPAGVNVNVNAGDTISASRTGNGGTALVVINFPDGSQAFVPPAGRHENRFKSILGLNDGQNTIVLY